MTWLNNVTFSVSSADPEDTPVWVDLSAYVRPTRQEIDLNTGRQTELDGSSPSQLTLMLDNADERFTFGNTSSPYAAWWGPGRRCRLQETVGGETRDLFVGYLEVPVETIMSDGVDYRWVTISAIDRLGRLEKSPAFLSTLTEYIRSDPTGTLVRYWPPVGGPKPFVDLIAGKTLFPYFNIISGAPVADYNPQDGPVALADDLDVPGFVPGTGGGYHLLSSDVNQSLGANEPVTVVGWFRPTAAAATVYLLHAVFFDDSIDTTAIQVFQTGSVITAFTFGGFLGGTIASTITLPLDVGLPIAVRYGYSPSVYELWIGSTRLTGTLAGTPPSTSSVLFQLEIGGAAGTGTSFEGRFGHLQVHVGEAFDFAAFQAQHTVGLEGMERQTTGDRIRAIADYAGLAVTDLGQIDDGQTAMSAALLAGQTPAAAMREAEQTEQGLLYVDGSGLLQFRDRRSLYNI